MLPMEGRMAALVVAVLAASVGAQNNSHADSPSPDAPCGDCCAAPSYRAPGLIVVADWIYWKARTDSLEFVERSTSVGSTTTTERDYVSLPHQSGVRAGLGYRFASLWDVAWIYTYHFTDGHDAAAAAPGVSLTVPGISVPIINSAAGRASLRYNVNDLEIGRWLGVDDHFDLRLFGSFRYATTETNGHEDVAGIYNNPGPENIRISTDIRSKMDAYGIRLGGEGRWRIGSSNLSLFGRGAGSVLAGRFENVGSVVRTTWQESTNVYRHHDTHAVCVLEAAAGAAYQYGNWEVSGGYELANWLNQTVPLTNVNQAAYGDLLLDGFFVRAAYKY